MKQEKCENCGLSMPRNEPKGAWKYFCTNDGKSKRGGDSCAGFWEKEDMKKKLDETAQLLRE